MLETESPEGILLSTETINLVPAAGKALVNGTLNACSCASPWNCSGVTVVVP